MSIAIKYNMWDKYDTFTENLKYHVHCVLVHSLSRLPKLYIW